MFIEHSYGKGYFKSFIVSPMVVSVRNVVHKLIAPLDEVVWEAYRTIRA